MLFLVGDAGLGKTDLMLKEARGRAKELEREPDLAKPLFLFVSSTGRTLASLEDAVNGALNITRILSSQSAKALCRRGMLVLFVDGFDELLGSSGYDNALGSLEPWFRELGGRGVLVASARSSYYLTQYRRSLSEAADLPVEHTVARILPWSKSEAQKYLVARGTPTAAGSNLSDRDWRLLGIPFFAKAFVAWHLAHPGSESSALPIFDIVVEQYLRREASKLADPHQGPLLSQDELKEFFSELAELMHLTKVRELEHHELVSCAQLAIGQENIEEQRPGLTHRLTALCGIDVSGGSQQLSKFSFSHESMFDCFLALALRPKIVGHNHLDAVRRILGAGKVQAAVFDWLVELEPEQTRRALTMLVSDTPGSVWTDTLGENVSSLWMSLFELAGGIPPTATAANLQLGELRLAPSGWTTLSLASCKVDRLVIPSPGSGIVSIPGTEIDLLECDSGLQMANALREVDANLVSAARIGNEYVDTPMSLRQQLESLGIVEHRPRNATQEVVEAATFFLFKLTRRFDAQVVAYTSTRIPDDDRLRWTRRLGDDAWLSFVGALERHALAHWDQIQAGDRSKSRLVFDVPKAMVASRQSGDARVGAFWDDIARQP